MLMIQLGPPQSNRNELHNQESKQWLKTDAQYNITGFYARPSNK